MKFNNRWEALEVMNLGRDRHTVSKYVHLAQDLKILEVKGEKNGK